MQTEDIITNDKKYFMNTYGDRIPIAVEWGEGCRLWDKEGREYLDFVAGIAVNVLGHNHRQVNSALKEQIDKVIHCSSLYYIEPQTRLAAMLVEHSCADRVFFVNSGAEANEAAIKLARRNFSADEGRTDFITMKNSFHGRTLATLAATGQDKYKKPFRPMPPGFRSVPFNSLDAVKAAVTENTCAIMIEPIQGESGIHPAEEEFLVGLRQLCDREGILLIMDEIQTGLGRTGDLFAYETYGVEPDIFTLAKGLGNGVPIGAVLAKEDYSAFTPGDHGTTFGGNPLACTAGLATLRTIIQCDLPRHCRQMGRYFQKHLEQLAEDTGQIREIRGRGLMIGVELEKDKARRVMNTCRREGLLLNAIGGRVLRFLPPLVVCEEDIDQAVAILSRVLKGR